MDTVAVAERVADNIQTVVKDFACNANVLCA